MKDLQSPAILLLLSVCCRDKSGAAPKTSDYRHHRDTITRLCRKGYLISVDGALHPTDTALQVYQAFRSRDRKTRSMANVIALVKWEIVCYVARSIVSGSDTVSDTGDEDLLTLLEDTGYVIRRVSGRVEVTDKAVDEVNRDCLSNSKSMAEFNRFLDTLRKSADR